MKRTFLFSFLLTSLFFMGCEHQNKVIFSPEKFKNPKPEISVHTWWHWLDGAITKEGITRDLEAMKKAGIGQATILNIGLFNGKDFGVKRIVFNSPEWVEMFKWALQEANRLGIKIGAHNCDGWSTSGGPWITPEMSMKQYVWTKTYVSGGGEQEISLSRPFAERDFYNDVAVIAYPVEKSANSFVSSKPECRVNNSVVNNWLFDGNPVSAMRFVENDVIQFSFEKDFEVGKIVIHPRKKFSWRDVRFFKSTFIISSSEDGKNFKKIGEFTLTGLNKSFTTNITPVKARYFRIAVSGITFDDTGIPFTISEMELLRSDENPSYNETIPHLVEKAIMVKPLDRTNFDEVNQTTAVTAINKDKIIDLTSHMDAEGKLNWSAPEGNWCILRFGYTTTGSINSPATAEGVGLECDKMDTTALNLHFSNYAQNLINNAGEYAGNTFKFLLIDSWESGYQNWTANIPAEFQKTQGYNLLNWIPVLCGETIGDMAQSEAFLYDFRKTIAGMVETNYYKHIRDLCHRNKIELHAEVIYGDTDYPPLEILRTNSYVDLPMFEFWAGHNQNTFTEYTPSKPFECFPVFGAVCYNIPVVGSEAYTGMAHYSESPNDLKSFGDRAFCSGINQMILHSYVHQPLDKQPGMTLGQWGAHFNRNNPEMQYASAWMDFQSRVQYVLQKGFIYANLVFYVGDQLPQYISNPIVNTLPFGYRAMACNFDLLNKAKVKDGKIVFENGLEYALLILPEYDKMELNTLKAIARLAEQGAIIVGPKPLVQLSLNGILKETKEFDELSEKVWGKTNGKNPTINEYGKGYVYSNTPVAEIIKNHKILPDFATNNRDSLNLIYIHRKYEGNDVYYVANQTSKELIRECVFEVGDKTPQIWNPMDGSVSTPEIFSLENGFIRIPVNFGPKESLIFIFENTRPRNFIKSIFSGDLQIFPSVTPNSEYIIPEVENNNGSYSCCNEENGNFRFVKSDYKEIITDLNKPEIFEVNEFEGSIEFFPAYPATIPVQSINSLKPLTEFSEPDIKYFAGTCKYVIRFSIPEDFITGKENFLLDIGNFESVAEVCLNNNKSGIIWLPGSKMNISGLLQKDNILEVRVANVFRNRIIGDYIQYKGLKNVWTSAPVERFLDAEKPLKPSGLMGPIKIEHILKKDL